MLGARWAGGDGGGVGFGRDMIHDGMGRGGEGTFYGIYGKCYRYVRMNDNEGMVK